MQRTQRKPPFRGTTYLLHWSEVPAEKAPSRDLSPILQDLISWGTDIATVLTRHDPDDRDAIERVRQYVLSWLAGDDSPEISVDDILMTAATLMAAIDMSVARNHTELDRLRHMMLRRDA